MQAEYHAIARPAAWDEVSNRSARSLRRAQTVVMRADQPLGEAGAALVGERLRTATKRLKAAKRGDPEGVHELRVAIRKIRAAMAVLEETVLDDGTLRRQDKVLSRLFSALGDVRDHDVLAQRVTTIARRRRLEKKGLRALARTLDERGKEAKRTLRKVQRRHAPAALFAKIGRDVVRAVARARRERDDRRVLVRHYAASVLVRRYEAVLAYEVVVPASVEVLHRLRVAIKKLRYAVDFFGGALGKHARELDRPLQTAQDQLGELHDHHVARMLVADVEQRHGGKRALNELRDTSDAEAQQLLAALPRSWKVIAEGRLATVLTRATRALLGARPVPGRALALRRAEPAR
jgi:triphosphatase